MFVVRDVVLSNWIVEKFFVCALENCKGACCLEGEQGAPLEREELPILDALQTEIAPFLTEVSQKILAETGPYVFSEEEQKYSTPTVGGRECIYAYYDSSGCLKCAFETAFQQGKISFQKPISCHLYPIRIRKYHDQVVVNYDVWEICEGACHFGKKLGVPLYQFLKEPLIRRFGQDWYEELHQTAQDYFEAKNFKNKAK